MLTKFPYLIALPGALCAQLGSDVKIDSSAPGAGSTFRVRLPVRSPDA